MREKSCSKVDNTDYVTCKCNKTDTAIPYISDFIDRFDFSFFSLNIILLKVPLEVREDFRETTESEEKTPAPPESTRPKRSCRGQSVRTTLGIKPRKPRGPGRGRGGKRGMGTRGAPAPVSTPPSKPTKVKKK